MLTYFDDEVKKYHPVVEQCLNNALSNTGLNEEYSIKWHYGAQTDGIPDFVLVETKTDDRIAVIEVKKTPGDTLSPRFGEQAMKYVRSLKDKNWGTDYHLHFCVTNIEFTQFYTYRDGASPMGCVLQGSPHKAGRFSEDYDQTLEAFTQRFEEYFLAIKAKTEPIIDGYFAEISLGLNKAFDELDELLGWADGKLDIATEIGRETAIYELLRISFYYYLQGKYTEMGSENSAFFVDLETHKDSSMLVKSLDSAFARAMEIDFEDILSNNTVDKMFPKGVSENKTIADIFSRFLRIMNKNSKKGISYRSELIDYVSLITGTLYDHEEMRISGKVMSDEILANILAGFTINSPSDVVLDPSCGDGNLLLGAYNRMKELGVDGHNQLLGQLHGIENDRNLVQLARFKLLCSDLKSVDKSSKTHISLGDCILDDFNTKYDSVVMNPPFIRNDTLTENQKIIAAKYKEHLSEINGGLSLWSKSSEYKTRQPNFYHYHIENGLKFLKDEGVMAIIVMEKMLNNKDGYGLKNLLLNHLEAIISYPSDFFKDSSVTTCILILRKTPNTDNIGFLNVKNTSLLADIDFLKTALGGNQDINDANLSLNFQSRSNLDPEDNWKLLLSKSGNVLRTFSDKWRCIPITDVFEATRGNSETAGGSTLIYLNRDNPIHQAVESQFRGPGLKNSKARRNLNLRKQDLEIDEAIHFPTIYDDSTPDGFPRELSSYPGFRSYWNDCIEKLGCKNKWKKIVANAFNHNKKDIEILIPRADRAKHAIYHNTLNESIVLSTNFGYLRNFKLSTIDNSKEIQIKFHAAFLLSSFGQLQLELLTGNQEGMRKLEIYHLQKLCVPDSSKIDRRTIEMINLEFNYLSSKPSNFVGLEGIDGPRCKLDLEIAKYLFSQDNLGFKNPQDLANKTAKILDAIVRERRPGGKK
ncbi:MAG: BpuSI family type II restriction endonuclease [Candidatus Thermoplasmatota archaeon]|nr:BpuSI family type II restriction endonuclease [Candidatus Thermoplasmatota archaeon]